MSDSQVFWYGDNLTVMRDHLAEESVDLIYLDPPFNSHRIYNRFFGETDGTESEAQRRAFEDYWTWGPEAARAFEDVVRPRYRRASVPAALSQTLEMVQSIYPNSNLLAYISMMAVRLIEMRRVLSQTGSLYLHCDPTASHYLKLILDALFGGTNFRNELIWKRSTAHSDGKQGRSSYGRIHDVLLYYTKSDKWTWNPIHTPYADNYAKSKYRHVEEGSGRLYRRGDLTAAKPGGDTSYEWNGIRPYPGRYWAYSKTKMEQFQREGRLVYTRNGMPEYKRYLDEMPGVPLQDLWSDIDPINSQAHERVNYPTQKPVTLLERVIRASSNPGDVVLDPFCGCGTAVVASQRLNRKWIGIDITHVAVSVLKQRLDTEFPDMKYRVRGEPEDVASAKRLADEKWAEFQAWIVDKVGGIPLNPTEEKKVAKKGKDGGVDGLLLFRDDPTAPRSKRMILSVKGGKGIVPAMVRELAGTVVSQKADAGVLLVAHEPTPGVLKTALDYGTYESELFAPGKQYPKIQVISVTDIFDPKWRGLLYPGSNTSTRTNPPPAGPATDLKELNFKPRKGKASAPPKKTRPADPNQESLPLVKVKKGAK